MSGSDTSKITAVIPATSVSAETEEKQPLSALVELKNGKVLFKQKSISFEKQSETLQEIVQFREMLEDRIKRQALPLTAIPDEHRPLIVKLAHESDKTLPALSKHIRQELLPTQDDDEGEEATTRAQAALPLSIVETALKLVMQRNNYGLDGLSGGKAPAAVCVWRWEVMDQHRDWLPKNAWEKAESRMAERAKRELLAIFESLPQDARDAILDPKGISKLPQKELNVVESEPASEDKSTPQSKKKKKKADEENDSVRTTLIFFFYYDLEVQLPQTKSSASKPPRIPKPVDPAKAAKVSPHIISATKFQTVGQEQEKLEKKAAKVEKEKKEKDAQDKSRSIMASFFAKPKAPLRTPVKAADLGVAGPSNISSEFEKTFKPFVLKKDTELAPINWFQECRKRRKRPSPVTVHDGFIVIDDDDIDMDIISTHTPNTDVSSMSVAGKQLPKLLADNNSRRRLPPKPDPRLKTYNPLCVREIVSKLSEAEVEGDDTVVRSLLSQLNDRSILPAKVLIFIADGRPGYFGTWTRNSRIIGPRTPFAKDVLVFDYGYDSGEEWEEEPVGEADDVVDDGDDEEDGDDPDSDADSWLVDDDEDPEIPLDMDHDLLDIPELPVLPSKRKAEDGEKKIGKKRKIVIPLVPYAKGPCWESTIGQCEYNIFDSYRIQMFNDTPLFFDPFTFVSTCVEDGKRETKAASSNRPILLDDGVFVVPSLPDRLVQVNGSIPASAAATSSTATPSGPPKKAAVPKQPFPDQHLPFVLQKIMSLQSSNITFLVEAIHRDLREHKVKKNMIEAKVREVGEKCKEKKFWIVKPGIQVSPFSKHH
ncbi:hypothetical protein C0991_008306 [Blastosporella zonata]|nr:hypothetical protein C0991_008306 [Blastosporella zonata]